MYCVVVLDVCCRLVVVRLWVGVCRCVGVLVSVGCWFVLDGWCWIVG